MNILIADQFWVCRAGIKTLLTEVDAKAEIQEAESFQEARKRLARQPAIDLILLDTALPGLTSLDAIRQLPRNAERASLVIFSSMHDRGDALRAVDLGAAGFIPKWASREEILKALKQVLSGEVYLPRAVLEGQNGPAASTGRLGRDSEAAREAIALLTGRQREVLAQLAQGMSNTKIAKRLGLSENTVRIHISAILRTLDLDNRTQAALLAAERLRQADRL